MGETDFLVFPNIDPIIVSLGPLSVRWYGMMYLLGFIAAYLLAKKRLPNSPWNRDQLSDLLRTFDSRFIGVEQNHRVFKTQYP